MDWAIMLDADDSLEGVPPPASVYALPDLDALLVRLVHGGLEHERIQFFRVESDWYYEGVVHEKPNCRKTPLKVGRLPPQTWMTTRCEGARSQDPHKYRRDAEMLETELAKKPGDERTLFYLAQSYRDAGMRDEAEEKYRAYLDLSGTNVQERYIASMNLSMLTKSPVEMLELVWRAIDLLPHRAEAPFSFLRRWRAEGRPVTQQIYAVANFVKGREPRKAGEDLFVNPDVYAWGLDDELAIAAFQTGHYRESMEASLRCVLGAPTEEMRLSALRNARAAKEKLVPSN